MANSIANALKLLGGKIQPVVAKAAANADLPEQSQVNKGDDMKPKFNDKAADKSNVEKSNTNEKQGISNISATNSAKTKEHILSNVMGVFNNDTPAKAPGSNN